MRIVGLFYHLSVENGILITFSMDIYPTTSNVQSVPKCTLFENFLAQILFGFLQIFLFFQIIQLLNQFIFHISFITS